MPEYSPIFGMIPNRLTSTGGSRAGNNIFGYKPIVPGLTSPKANLLGAEPLIGDISTLAAQNIGTNLRGELSDAFKDAVTDAIVSRGIAGGVGGSDFLERAIALEQGRQAQGLQQLGQQQAMSYIPTISKAFTNDPLDIFGANYLKALVEAAPDPAARAQWEMEQFDRLNRNFNPVPGTGTRLGGQGSVSSVTFPASTPTRTASPGGYSPLSVGGYAPATSQRSGPAPVSLIDRTRSMTNYSGVPTTGDLYGFDLGPVAPATPTPTYAGIPAPFNPATFTPTYSGAGYSPSTTLGPVAPMAPTTVFPGIPAPFDPSTFAPSYSSFQYPSNYGELTGQQQTDYVTDILRYADVDPSLYE